MGKSVLLHVCCAPCSIATLKIFTEKGFEPVGYFFNPNIHPYREFSRRKETARQFFKDEKTPLLIKKIISWKILRMVVHREKQRCLLCYCLRWRAARQARGKRYGVFFTTL